MTQMEHIYLSWGLGGGEQALRYREDDYAVDTIGEDRHLRARGLEHSV